MNSSSRILILTLSITSASSATFNPLYKVVELYERLVQDEKDKVEYLEKLLNGK
jgi:hypothetical protein